jgi:hypothetical protein
MADAGDADQRTLSTLGARTHVSKTDCRTNGILGRYAGAPSNQQDLIGKVQTDGQEQAAGR